jgi:fructose-1,6-bisphosphatase/inositol monophosphatase family enzyme
MGLKFWDMCGPEALIKGTGGMATNFNQKPLNFAEQDHRLNGLIAARTPSMHKLICNRLAMKAIRFKL